MIGSVTVGIITPESTGASDPNTETWSSVRRDTVVSKIAEGLQWWKDNANAPSNLSFVFDIHHSVPTSFEPISRSSNDENLWIGQVMAALGFPSGGGSYFGQVWSYLNDQRDAFGTDWAFAIFVVDSLNDADGEFQDGSFAYAYVNGPFMVMTYDNDNWGIDRMQIVTAHEYGHIWGALDEYASSGCTDSETSGYLNIANTNCENGDPATEDSVMRGAANQESAFPNHRVSAPARRMVGWRDLDGDGKELYDPVDTIPSVTLTSNPDETGDRTPTYSGFAVDVPFLSPNQVDVTINGVAAVEWRLDGGPWQEALSTDGNFDSDSEHFTFTSMPLTSGAHTFDVRARNTAGNFSPVVSDSVNIAPIISVDCPTASLQDAISISSPGDTVLVSGTCSENVIIRNEGRRFILDGGGTATIDGPSSSSPAVNIRGKGIVIRGFTITGGSVGIDVNRGANVFVDGNTIENTGGAGILLQDGTFGGVINNTIQNNPGAGIVVSGGSTARIGFSEESDTVASDNAIQGNAIGIAVMNGSNAWIVGNQISGNSGDGVLVTRRSSADISSNTINSNGGDGVEIRDNSVVQLGEDSGSSIFASPNSTTSNNTGVGVRCTTGGVADGRRGTLTGAGGTVSFAGTCINDLN
jgi:parallel beta-helix repeat protein